MKNQSLNIKLFFLVLLFFGSSYLMAQTKLYVHPDGDKYAESTNSIAILPLRTQIKLRPKELKDFTQEQIIQMGKDESLDIQKGMHSWFLKRKQRGELKANIQPPAQTNAKLLKAGIDIHDLDIYTPQELGEILVVDCLIMGTFETSKPMGSGAALGIMLLTGGAAATSSATVNMDFYNTKDGELVVNYLKQIKGSLGSNAQDLINVLMRKVTRRIPYTK